MSWWQGLVRCDACGHEHRAVIEIEPDADAPDIGMECPACRHMTCWPVED